MNGLPSDPELNTTVASWALQMPTTERLTKTNLSRVTKRPKVMVLRENKQQFLCCRLLLIRMDKMFSVTDFFSDCVHRISPLNKAMGSSLKGLAMIEIKCYRGCKLACMWNIKYIWHVGACAVIWCWWCHFEPEYAHYNVHDQLKKKMKTKNWKLLWSWLLLVDVASTHPIFVQMSHSKLKMWAFKRWFSDD